MVEGNGPPFVPFLTRNAAAHVGGNHVGQHPMALVDDIVVVRDRRTGARPASNSLVPPPGRRSRSVRKETRLGRSAARSGRLPAHERLDLTVNALVARRARGGRLTFDRDCSHSHAAAAAPRGNSRNETVKPTTRACAYEKATFALVERVVLVFAAWLLPSTVAIGDAASSRRLLAPVFRSDA